MSKYTLDEFMKKYGGKRHICCGINYADGEHETMINSSCSQIISKINQKNKELAFIVTK